VPGLSQANIADYDGLMELTMPSLSCFDEAQKDPYYLEVVAPDELKFADVPRTKILIGWEEVYVKDGKKVEVQPGEANVVRG